MKVAQLAKLLDSLMQGVEGLTGQPVMKDLQTFRQMLEPFADRTVADWAKYLEKCARQQAEPPVPRPAKAPKATTAEKPKKPGPEEVAAVIAAVKGVLDDINGGGVDMPRIERTVAPLAGFTKAQLHQVMAGLNIPGKPAKGAAIEVIHNHMRSQYEMWVKANSWQ